MTATIQIKRRVGSAGVPSALAEGEPAFHDPGGGPADLYIGTTPAGVLPLVSNSRQVEIAGSQTITGVKTFTTSSFKLTGGLLNYILQTDGAGNLSWVALPPLGITTVSHDATMTGDGSATPLSVVGFQPLDGDLTALAALTGTNTIYYRSGVNTWSPVTMGGNMTFSGGVLNSTGAGGGGIPEAPTDSKYYSRRNANWADIATAFLPLAGGTLTGLLTLSADPSGVLDAATKQYVDNSRPWTLTVLTATNAAWPVPPGTKEMMCHLWGGGASGGGSASSARWGGGGGGCYVFRYYKGTMDSTLNITIGAGAVSAALNAGGNPGGATSIVGTNFGTTTAGGAASVPGSGAGGAGGVPSGTYDYARQGGDGFAGSGDTAQVGYGGDAPLGGLGGHTNIATPGKTPGGGGSCGNHTGGGSGAGARGEVHIWTR